MSYKVFQDPVSVLKLSLISLNTHGRQTLPWFVCVTQAVPARIQRKLKPSLIEFHTGYFHHRS